MATLISGTPLLVQQWRALVNKNMKIASRNKRATLIQILAPFIFMFLFYVVEKTLSLSSWSLPELKAPPSTVVQGIPPCETKFYVKRPCFDFVWSGNSSRRAHDIVSRIMANNFGRPISSNKVKSFGTPAEVDAWLFNDPLRCPATVHFAEKNATVISYGVQANFTRTVKGGIAENPTMKFLVPLQVAVEREIARSFLGDDFQWTVGLKEFPRPAAPMGNYSVDDNFGILAPVFLFTITMFAFLFQISAIALEKEQKLRQAMNIMGLYDSAYWLSWLTWESLVILVSSLCTIFSGMIFRFDLFLHNSFATAIAFLLSAFIGKSSSAFRAGFWIFLIGAILQFTAQVIGPDSKKGRYLYFLPPSLLAHAIGMLIGDPETKNKHGISWKERAKCPVDSNCVLTLNDVYIRLIYTFFCWFLLALYFDNVVPSPNGTVKPLLYFLNPRYWIGRGGNTTQGGICGHNGSIPAPDHNPSTDEDVLEEENTVKWQMSSNEVDPNIAVQVRGLAKTFPGKLIIRCCCGCRRTDPFHAIKGLYLNVVKDQLFCLLGPNGAGKTTTINCLTGITSVTRGDAIVHGNSIRSSVGMSNIRKMIGVCPQFDILWNVLTGEEHLQLFACIKGLQPASIKQVVKKSLEEVRLSDSAKVRAGSYSGGMRRRLSVASALLGDPKLIILDEPTTGMDPISRRHVWDIIENAKRGRAIILTTHSMEEADVLGDRIGIMAKGRLRCLGTSIRLKSRFGTGFVTNLSFANTNSTQNSANKEAVKAFFKQSLGVSPKEESNAFLTFVIPRQKEVLLKRMLGEFQDRQREFGVADIQLGLTTLDEVFLNIARQAELETAASEGRFVTLDLASGTSVKIPVGARYVAISGTENAQNPRGVMVEVYWEQDDSGALCISGHSPERPVPLNVQPTLPVAPPKNLDRHIALGLVIDPSQL
ncbi:hypothetical protein RND81_13G120800 [Saponaria officinalis]|uniref:ABC transporter domain-containing protein n=1 Tax=Saponaria officinalis TaxID=3572 RepID=A0AAW1H1I9_SAPOF